MLMTGSLIAQWTSAVIDVTRTQLLMTTSMMLMLVMALITDVVNERREGESRLVTSTSVVVMRGVYSRMLV